MPGRVLTLYDSDLSEKLAESMHLLLGKWKTAYEYFFKKAVHIYLNLAQSTTVSQNSIDKGLYRTGLFSFFF